MYLPCAAAHPQRQFEVSLGVVLNKPTMILDITRIYTEVAGGLRQITRSRDR